MALTAKARTQARVALGMLWMVCASSVGWAQSLELRQGVVVDLDAGRVYVMRPDNSVEAMRIDDGASLWRAGDAGQPLAVSGNVLLTASAPVGGGPELELSAYDAGSGAVSFTSDVALPEGVRALMGNTMSSSFSAKAIPVGDEVYISWSYVNFPRRGMLEEEPAEAPTPTTGALVYDTGSRESTAVQPEALPETVRSAMMPTAGEASPSAGERQSIDGRHTLRSERIADNNTWDNYRWTIVDNSTGGVVGRMRSHLASVPFVIEDSKIVFEAGPHARRVEGAMQEQPLRVQAVDLTSGENVWSRDVRDMAYRGPFPP